MKTLIATTAILVATTASAFALSSPDAALFGVDAATLTQEQADAVSRAIASGGTNGEVKALIKSIVNNG